MFKKKGLIHQETFIKILSNNAKTDMTGIKKVVGAGGNPGEEAESINSRWKPHPPHPSTLR
jgi:hypothetical protein